MVRCMANVVFEKCGGEGCEKRGLSLTKQKTVWGVVCLKVKRYIRTNDLLLLWRVVVRVRVCL